jgi:hypothetical protein
VLQSAKLHRSQASPRMGCTFLRQAFLRPRFLDLVLWIPVIDDGPHTQHINSKLKHVTRKFAVPTQVSEHRAACDPPCMSFERVNGCMD